MRLTFELFEAAEQMMRLNLRRRIPEADGEEIERRLTEWLHTRPGAEHGDASGPHFRGPRTEVTRLQRALAEPGERLTARQGGRIGVIKPHAGS